MVAEVLLSIRDDRTTWEDNHAKEIMLVNQVQVVFDLQLQLGWELWLLSEMCLIL